MSPFLLPALSLQNKRLPLESSLRLIIVVLSPTPNAAVLWMVLCAGPQFVRFTFGPLLAPGETPWLLSSHHSFRAFRPNSLLIPFFNGRTSRINSLHHCRPLTRLCFSFSPALTALMKKRPSQPRLIYNFSSTPPSLSAASLLCLSFSSLLSPLHRPCIPSFPPDVFFFWELDCTPMPSSQDIQLCLFLAPCSRWRTAPTLGHSNQLSIKFVLFLLSRPFFDA